MRSTICSQGTLSPCPIFKAHCQKLRWARHSHGLSFGQGEYVVVRVVLALRGELNIYQVAPYVFYLFSSFYLGFLRNGMS